MRSAIRMDHRADLSNLERESCVLKGLHHLARTEFAQAAAVAGAAAIAVNLGNLSKVGFSSQDFAAENLKLLDSLRPMR